jgi:hypothetical protein
LPKASQLFQKADWHQKSQVILKTLVPAFGTKNHQMSQL